MSESVLKLYREFYELFGRANSNLTKGQAHDGANLKWNSMKKGGTLDMELYKAEVAAMNAKLCKRKLTMFDFSNNRKLSRSDSSPAAAPASQPDPKEHSSSSSASSSIPESGLNTASDVPTASISSDSALVENPGQEAEVELEENEGDRERTSLAVRDTPAQTKIKEELNEINSELVKLNEARNLGLGEETSASLTKQIKEKTAKKDSLQKKLKLNELWRKNSQKQRDKKKEALKQASRDYPGLAEKLKFVQRESTGRPPLEDVYPNIHRDILEIATIGSAASDRRREETIRSVKTLSDLHKALSDMGYQISTSALYNRLIPKGVSVNEAKKHVRTVPVR